MPKSNIPVHISRTTVRPASGSGSSIHYHYEEDMFTGYNQAEIGVALYVFDEGVYRHSVLWHTFMRMMFGNTIPRGSEIAEVYTCKYTRPFDRRAFAPLFNAAIDEARQTGAYAIYIEVWPDEMDQNFFKAIVSLLGELRFQLMGTSHRNSHVYAIKFGANPPGKLNKRTWRLVVRKATPRLREDPRRADPDACERAVNAALEETGIDVGSLSTGQIEGLWADVLCAAATLDELQK
jgi:hypothetical protein